MKAIILAAGRGSRMKNLTDDRPKCLLDFRGQSLLHWQLRALKEAGISQIALVTGYRRELLEGKVLKEFYNSRWSDTNMVSSLEYAREWLEAGPCIVSYSDIFYGADAVRSLIDCPASLAITYDPDWRKLWEQRFSDPLSDAETFRLSGSHDLVEIGGRARVVDEIQGQYMGLLRFTPEGWAEVSRVRSDLDQNTRDRMHMTGTLQKVIDEGKMAVRALAYTGEWGEFDSQSDLLRFT
jgi:choline kinase